MSGTVLVIGGTGMLGEPVARQLAAAGHRVRIYTRNADTARQRFAKRFEIAAGDIEDESALRTALDGCAAVHVSLDGKGDWDLERRGLANVSRLAAELGLSRISTISGASTCEENTWFPMVKAKLAGENAVRECGVPYSIFRCSMFMETLPNFVRDGKAMVMGNQPHPWHWVAATDYARMVVTALSAPAAANKTLYVYGPQPLTMEEAVECYRSICAPQAKLTRVPLAVLAIVALFPGRQELRRVGLPLMRYFSKVQEIGDATEANELLGAPTLTVERWCRVRTG